MADEAITIEEDLSIPGEEISFRTSRSSGPGGQHVNKVETRVTLLFDVLSSPSLSEEQKRRITSRLQTRVSKAGVLRVVAQKHRSQSANREEARERFAGLLREVLRRDPPRKATRPTTAAKSRRLEEKRRRGRRKQERARREYED